MRTWTHAAILACLSIKWLTLVLAETVICDDPTLCTDNQDLSKGDHDSGEDDFDERSTHADPDDRGFGIEDSYFRDRRGDPFLRFGRGDPFLRFGRGDPFLRFGRGDPFLRFGRGDPFLRFGRGDPFLRFGRGDPFLRFGRGDPFLRFGRDDQVQRKTRGDPFLRFGRGDPFLRFGRGDPFLRFGRGDPFLRFGRGDPFLRFGRGDPFLRFGRGDPFLRFGRDNSEARVARGDPFLRFGRFKVSADSDNSPLELDDEDISRRASDDKTSRRKREASPVETTASKRFLDSSSANSKEKSNDKRSNIEIEEARQARNGPYMRFGRNNMVYDLLDDNKENLLDDEYTRQAREPSRIAYPRYGKRSE